MLLAPVGHDRTFARSLQMSTPSHAPVDMPFTVAAAVQMLRWGALSAGSPYSHEKIAEWCDQFWCQYLEVDAPPDVERLLPILTAVDTQWDLFLTNTYSFQELRTGSFEQVRMPVEWFEQWLCDATDGNLAG
ncbi:hypothetical protein D9M68_555590 [compost metagenome]|uniref:hypothetical protein n=1 Tax=Variovorax sp. V118 TaxID=3065954 RepID=UPI000FA09FF2